MLILGSSVNIGAKRGPFLLPIKQIYDTLYANLGDLSIDLAEFNNRVADTFICPFTIIK